MPLSVPRLTLTAAFVCATLGSSPISPNSFWQKMREEAALIPPAFGIDDEGAFELGLGENHVRLPRGADVRDDARLTISDRRHALTLSVRRPVASSVVPSRRWFADTTWRPSKITGDRMREAISAQSSLR